MESLHSNIKFICTDVVALTEQRINFLDVCVYRKSTHSNTVLNFQSSHIYNIKLGVAIEQFKEYVLFVIILIP